MSINSDSTWDNEYAGMAFWYEWDTCWTLQEKKTLRIISASLVGNQGEAGCKAQG
ncbi:MAG: hypothetical protein IJ242_07735 [Clostridia bacterium]|nr:hypothetical protein [Clostridia bacterium]